MSPQDQEKATRSTIAPDTPHNDLSTQTQDSHVVLDGGWEAWSQVLVAHLTNALTWGYAATFGVYQLHYVQSLSLASAQVSWIGSIQTLLTFGMTAFSGRLADAGYTRITVAVGTLLAVGGTFMTSLCTQYWQIVLAQGVCTGLGCGICYMPAVAVASSYFKERRALALCVAAAGTNVGSVVFPATVQYLIPKVGFPWAVRCSGFIALVAAGLINLMIRPRLAPRKTGPLIEWNAFKDLEYMFFAAAAFLFFYALYFGFFYINTFAREVVGFSTVESVNLLLITNGLGGPPRPIVGSLADHRVGPINMFIITSAILSLMLFCWIAVESRAGMYVFCVFFGIANGSAQGMFVGGLASLTKDPQKMGIRFGMVTTLCAFATLAGPPTAGAIIDRSGGDFVWAQVWGALVLIGAVIMLIASRVVAVGWNVRVRV